MKDAPGILAILDRRIQVVQQSRPEFRRELKGLIEARAAVAELMAVVEAFLDLPLQPKELEERAVCALGRAHGAPSDDY